MSFEGRVAAVTGGGAGIGEAICHRLAADGAKLAVLDLSLDTAQRTAQAIDGAIALQVDVADSGAVDLAVEQIERELGPLAIFVNNAGAVGLEHVRRVTPLLERQREEIAASGCAQTPLDALARLTDEEWRSLLAVHLDGTFYGTRAAARAMAPRGVGVIVNMASICGLEGCTGHPHYSAAKAGILGLTRSVAKELIVQGIRVNAVAPGFVDTRRLKGSLGAGRQAELARTPLGRLGTPEEIAAAVAFLASDDAAYFVGATLTPNGGLLTT
jgi:NAD(P)-dependent dehydrogenase (short-subunit alcohol dehydrogenase family)